MLAGADLTGQRFGRLVVRAKAGRRDGYVLWSCDCDCGTRRVLVRTGNLTNRAQTTSCGCVKRERLAALASKRLEANTKHGHAGRGKTSRAYHVWHDMRARCTNPSDQAYKYYGGRGITVCERWLESFENFLADMGEPPVGLTLDRKNNDGNYEPRNCRWVTRKEQAANKRRTTMVCEVCKQSFSTVQINARYCSPICKRHANNSSRRAAYTAQGRPP